MNADLSWLENPEVFRVNRLDAHSDHHFYETEEDLEKGRETLRQSLNGSWKFHWSRNPSERPEDFYKEDADCSFFGEIQVPGHMELQGYDKIHYINNLYPWEGHTFLRPPHIDWEYNPVGSYVKEFDLEEGLCGKRVCISFQGVEQAMYVWLNGRFIGYAEDSFTPSEFDLSGTIREKENRLCVEVYKRSSAAWLEDQDFFRFSGIFREVYLYAKPEAHVEDLWVKAGLLEECLTGTMELEVKLSGLDKIRVAWELQGEQGKPVCSGMLTCGTKNREKALLQEAVLTGGQEKCQVNVGDSGEMAGFSEPQCYRQELLELPGIQKWNVGNPYLYRLLIRVMDEQGNLLEIVPYRIGFRRFEIRDKVMLLNGERLKIYGVNRHEWNPRTGRAISEADMRNDIEIMKRNRINAVRTCHYPNQSLWYQLCDEAGICVMDEANLESHGSWQKMGQCEPSWNVPGSLPRWKACVVDRASSMLERDKNHPSILWWSCGNESYAGADILAMSDYFHEKDPSRLVHYEGVYWNREFNEISDVESRMYAQPREIRNYLEKEPSKPFLLCEYMHNMGNSIGGMDSYMQLMEEFPMYQGGFIWDFVDQALYYRDENGKEVLGYGGDFDDRPTDYAFSGNGLLFADRREKPAMQEVRYWYQDAGERERFTAENERLRREAEECILRENAGGNDETALQDIVLEQSGAEGGFGQKRALVRRKNALRVVHGDLTLGIGGEDFHIIFSYPDGGPVSLVYDGKECLYRAPRPVFWRASTDNDKGNGFAVKSAVWLGADLFSSCVKCSVTERAGDREEILEPFDLKGRKPAAEDLEQVTVSYIFETRTVPSAAVKVDYTVQTGGRLRVEVQYQGQKGLPQLPLFGMRFVMPHLEKTVRWEGLSGETYPDRMRGGKFGVHESSIGIADHLVPQECGNHVGTCWMQAGGLRIVMDQEPFQFSALPYTAAELENALHREELPMPRRTVVNILARMRGVGGIDSWGADVEEKYHISGEEDICYSFYVEKGV